MYSTQSEIESAGHLLQNVVFFLVQEIARFLLSCEFMMWISQQ